MKKQHAGSKPWLRATGIRRMRSIWSLAAQSTPLSGERIWLRADV
jgi:hypothetical protein